MADGGRRKLSSKTAFPSLSPEIAWLAGIVTSAPLTPVRAIQEHAGKMVLAPRAKACRAGVQEPTPTGALDWARGFTACSSKHTRYKCSAKERPICTEHRVLQKK